MNDRLDIRYFPLVLDVVDQGVITVDPQGRISSFDKATQTITGYKEGEVLGKECAAVFRSNLCQTICPLRRSIASRDRIRNQRVRVLTKDGRLIPIAISTAPFEGRSGELLGGEVFADLSHVEDLERKIHGQYQVGNIVTHNPEMRRILDMLPMVAESSSTILVTGPTGTRKELLAKPIHNQGPRRRKPFVAVYCGALPETLI